MEALLGLPLFFGLPALYLWMQFRALRAAWRGGLLRIAAVSIPMLVMAFAVFVGVGGAMAGSGIAPVIIFVAIPPCLLWLAVYLGVDSLFA